MGVAATRRGRPKARHCIPRMRELITEVAPIESASGVHKLLHPHAVGGGLPAANLLGRMYHSFGLCSDTTAIAVLDAINALRGTKSLQAVNGDAIVPFDCYLDSGVAVASLQVRCGGNQLMDILCAELGYPERVINSVVLKQRLAPALIVDACRKAFMVRFQLPVTVERALPSSPRDPVPVNGGRDWIWEHLSGTASS